MPESFDPHQPATGPQPEERSAPSHVVSHQTVKLRQGNHSSPEQGACVMELASMLAGEPFSDHPASVCPVIGSFLRAYNDAIDYERRQDLYAYASHVVGSRVPENLQHLRAERLLAWARAHQLPLCRGLARLPIVRRLREVGGMPPLEAIGSHAVRTIRRHTDRSHTEALALIDELLAIGGEHRPPAAPARTAPSRVASQQPSPGGATAAPPPDQESVALRLIRARHNVT